jgi:uncharacterized protein YcfL
MRKWIIAILMLAFASAGCSSGRKSYSELRGLMLLDNSQIGRNRSYYSKHGRKKLNTAHKKYEKKGKFK